MEVCPLIVFLAMLIFVMYWWIIENPNIFLFSKVMSSQQSFTLCWVTYISRFPCVFNTATAAAYLVSFHVILNWNLPLQTQIKCADKNVTSDTAIHQTLKYNYFYDLGPQIFSNPNVKLWIDYLAKDCSNSIVLAFKLCSLVLNHQNISMANIFWLPGLMYGILYFRTLQFFNIISNTITYPNSAISQQNCISIKNA